jgi:hypothetical protein
MSTNPIIDISSFNVRTSPPPDYEPWHFFMGGIEVVSSDLRAGAIKLFNKAGYVLEPGKDIDEQLAGYIKRQPKSFGQTMLLTIFDNPLIKRLNEQIKKPLPSPILDPDDELLNQGGTPDNPPIVPDTENDIVTEPTPRQNVNVTAFPTPVKPPNRRRGHSNIIDSIVYETIKETIENPDLNSRKKGYRTIRAILITKGIDISFMKVKRIAEEMRQRGDLHDIQMSAF